MVHVTEKAAEAIKSIMQKEGLADHGLRLAVAGASWSRARTGWTRRWTRSTVASAHPSFPA